MEYYPLHSTEDGPGLIEQVKVAIDENVTSEELDMLKDVETLKLEEIIASKVADAARLVVEAAPHRLLDGGIDVSGAAVTWDGDDGRMLLPFPFLRLVVFQTEDWRIGVTDAISEDSADYLLQSSPWKGIRGNAERPVVAVVRHADGDMLEFYGSSQGSAVIRAMYLPVPAVDDGRIGLCGKLVRPTVYRAAMLTALTLGAADSAAALSGICNELLTEERNG